MKEPVMRMKRQPQTVRKYLQNFGSRIYKVLRSRIDFKKKKQKTLKTQQKKRKRKPLIQLENGQKM